MTRVQPELIAVGRLGTPPAARVFEERTLRAAPGWDGKHSERGEPSFGSVKRRQGDRVPLASTPVPDGVARNIDDAAHARPRRRRSKYR